jgi:hypothetical protein
MIKSFKLGGKTFKVKEVDHDTENLGRSNSPLLEIQIQRIWNGKEIPNSSKEQTLIHEVVHCILDELGHLDLNRDEVFVQSFSSMLYQFMQSSK